MGINLPKELEKPEKQEYKIDFLAEEGAIQLLGIRRVMFPAEAFGDMRKELIDSLGQDIARQIIFRFGYQCGVRDAVSIEKLVENRDLSVLQGPFFHQIQGIVLAKNESLQFQENGKFAVMKGYWFNSYEADQHLRHHGLAEEAVCWSLAGYASGFAATLVQEELLCIETACRAGGNDQCSYEIRPVEKWPPAVRQKWLPSLKELIIEKNLTNLLAEERQRNYRQQVFNECLGQITEQQTGENLLRKLIYHVQRLVKARYTALFATPQQQEIILEDEVGDKATLADAPLFEELVNKACYFGEPFLQTDINSKNGSLRLLAMPVTEEMKVNKVIVIVTEQKIEYETIETLKLLIHFTRLLLDKLKLQEDLTTLKEEDEQLKKEQADSQQTLGDLSYIIDTTQEFLNYILHGRGMTALIQELGEETQTHLVLLNENQQIFGRNIEKKRAEQLVHRLKKNEQKSKSHFSFPLLAGQRKLGELLAVERHAQLTSKGKMLLEAGAKIIALEILKEQEAQLKYRFNFFELLLTGEYSSREILVTQANKVNFQLDGTYQMIGITLEDLNPGVNYSLESGSLYENLYHQVRNFIKGQSANSKALIFAEQMIIFLSYADKAWTKEELDILFKQLLQHLKKSFASYGIYLVSGRVCQSLNCYPMAYQEIKSCLSIMKRLKQRDRPVFFEKLGVLTILFEVEQTKLVEFVNRTLGALVDYDDETGLELLPTLSIYIKNNFNIQSTARNHFISASTLKYRLRKIRDLGIDLEDPEVRLNVQLALKLTEFQ